MTTRRVVAALVVAAGVALGVSAMPSQLGAVPPPAADFTFSNVHVTSTCAGVKSRVVVTDTWASKVNYPHSYELDQNDRTVQSFRSAPGTGSDSVLFTAVRPDFTYVTPGRHTVDLMFGFAVSKVPVVVCPTSLSIVSPSTALRGAAATVAAALHNTTTGRALAGVAVQLLARTSPGAPFKVIANRTTAANGSVGVRLTARTTTQYQWRYLGSSAVAGTTSPARWLIVH